MNQQNPNRVDPKEEKTKAVKKTNGQNLWLSPGPVTPICSEAKIVQIEGPLQAQPRRGMTVGEILDLCSDLPAPGQYWKDTTSALPSLLRTRLVHYLNRIQARYRAFLILVLTQRAVAPMLEANMAKTKDAQQGNPAFPGSKQKGEQPNNGKTLDAALDAGEEWNLYAESHGLNTEERALGFVVLMLWDCGRFAQELLEHGNDGSGPCRGKCDHSAGQPHPGTLAVLTRVFARLTQPYQVVAREVIGVLGGSASEKHLRLREGIRWSFERSSNIRLGRTSGRADQEHTRPVQVSGKAQSELRGDKQYSGEAPREETPFDNTVGTVRAAGYGERPRQPQQMREMRKPGPSLEWAAGMLDGDGCITLARHTYSHRNSTLVLLITITQNCRETLEYFCDSVGIPATIYPTKRRAQHSKQVYVVNYTGRKAKELIERLDGRLFRKRLEAQLAIDFYEKGQVGRRFGRHGLPPAIKEFREACFHKMRALK